MTPTVRKAYAQYCSKYDYKPTLNTYPTMYFIHKTTGETIKKSIHEIYLDLGYKLNVSTGKWAEAKKGKKERIL